MPDSLYDIHGIPVYECAADGAKPRNDATIARDVQEDLRR